MIPLRYPLALLGLALVLAVPLMVLLFRGDGASAGRFRGSTPPEGIEVPGFSLRDQFGRRVESSDLRGKAAAITFLDTRCREACPIIAGEIGRALDLLDPDERRRVTALAITVDPRHDTPRAARAFLRPHGVELSLRFLLGERAELRPVWKAFSVLPVTGDADVHSAPVRVYDPNGVWVSSLHTGVDLTAENLAHDLRAALD